MRKCDYGVNGSESRFTPKTLRDRGRYEEGTHNIKNVTKFAFGTVSLKVSIPINWLINPRTFM